MFKPKNLFRILLDSALLTCAWVLATYIRLEGMINTPADKFIWDVQLIKILPLVVLVQILSLIAFGTYKRFWRYTSVNDLIHISRSIFIAAIVIISPRFLGYNPHTSSIIAASYGIAIIDLLLAISFLASLRLIRSSWVNQKNIQLRLRHLDGTQKRTLIIGGGEAALQVIQSINTHPETGLKIVGVLDDDARKHKMNLVDGVTVYGTTSDVKFWVDELQVDQIIIAIPSLNLKDRKKINLLCNETGVDVRTIPGVDQLAGGKVSVEQIRKLSMEDLLGREEVDLSGTEVHSFLEGKRVLVTGAGGSIGRELCIQLIKNCNISSICLLGKGENSIFGTWQDIIEYSDRVQIEKKIVDIRNYDRMDAIFSEFKPDVVFHAAAHKHVHLMELNPCEAFENNVLGTRNVAELSGKHKVEAFVLISTDKAVNPTSIMGSTKSLAEKVTLMASKDYPQTKYTAVRFGNVLGSRGSVITVWEQQVKAAKAITVTHKDAFRYFMTIPEAAQLVIQAAARAANGEIMVLDMGEPVKIYDLAKQFIQLSGLSLEDVPIEFIGLKEGEKLHEELLTSSEFIDHKLADKIYKAKINNLISNERLKQEIQTLTESSRLNDQNMTKIRLRSLVAELSKEIVVS
jgi:FlaA1/EpsC-like NDP-sugar epimerase